MKRSSSVLAVLLVMSGCASVPAPPTIELPVIVLEEEADGAHWRATWHLAEPSRELLFERNAAGFRPDVLEVITPGFTFGKRGEQEVLRTEGEAVSTISVRFPEYSEWLPKEYELFQTFSDGSVAVYTGHFVARPVVDDASDDCEECFIRGFRFTSAPGSPIVVDGRVARSPVEWHDEHEQGSYVYFGSIEPVATPEMISIVDPALPDWLETETKRALPDLFELYAERFGVRLPSRPTVLFSYDVTDQPGHSSGGGTLPGQIQLTVHGTGWKDRSDDAMLHLFHFLAHEAAHLWNGQIVNYPGSEHSWMHEGSADAFAQRALLELGLIDDQRFLDYQTTALNDCRSTLGRFPLSEAASQRELNLYYTCGNMLALTTEQTIDSRDLFELWRTLIARSLESGTYGADDYLAVWSDLGADWGDVESLRRFVSEEADADAIAGMLRRSGVSLVEDPEPPQAYRRSVSRDALLALMSGNCNGRYGFNLSPHGFELSDPLDCGPIPGGGRVTAIGEHHVLHQGNLTWDLIRERCGRGEPVGLEVQLEGETSRVMVPCTANLAARPRYLRISSRGQPGDEWSVEQIKSQSKRLSDSYVRGDIASLVDVYTDHGVAIPGGRDAIRGRSDLLKLWELPDGRTMIRHEATPVEIVIDGDLAYDWGYYEGQAAENGEPLDPFRGIYTIVWKRGDDGLWRIAVDMWHGLR